MADDNLDKQIEYKRLELANNTMLLRHEWIRKMHGDARRDLDGECHYPEEISLDDYWRMYRRFGIARRVNDIYPVECFKMPPRIYEDPDENTTTAFEEELDAIGNQLDRENWMTATESTGNVLFDYIRRADVLSGLGTYGVMLFGLDDGKELHEPARMRKGQQLNYIRCLPEVMAPVASVDTDKGSKRIGRPNFYNVTLRATETVSHTFKVHHSRILHVADNRLWSDVEGLPRLESVWNHLLDLRKIYGASAEGYWQGGFPGLSIETHPQLGGEVVLDVDELRNQLEDRRQGLQRDLALLGMTAKTLLPNVADPTAYVNALIDAICMAIGSPKRIFMGTEQGVLAGDQDTEGWGSRLMIRNMLYLAPFLIGAVVNRLISYGCLTEPEQFYIDWRKPDEVSDTEVAEASLSRAQALQAYVAGNVDSLIEPLPFLTMVMKFDPDDAEEALTTTLVEGERLDVDLVTDEKEAERAEEEKENNPEDTKDRKNDGKFI